MSVSRQFYRLNGKKWWICKAIFYLNLLSIPGLFLIYSRISIANYYSPVKADYVAELTSRLRSHRCNFPKIKPFSEDVLPHLKKVSSVNCINAANFGELVFDMEKGTRILKKLRDIDGNCCYRPFHRVDDSETYMENHCHPITGKRTEIPQQYEFIEVICVGGSRDYRDGFAIISKKPEVEKWIENVDNALNRVNDTNRMSVMIFGLDATSHMNFLRMLPKSSNYLIHNMSAIVLNGYTKVAENTLPNIVPVLSGQTLSEFKLGCIDKTKSSNEVHLDNCPFIWKKFSATGYRTGFAEDDVGISIFNMDWGNAFKAPPTDYYLRPFSKHMQHSQDGGDGLCYGTRLSYKVLLDNLENTAVVFKNDLHFQFTWATKLSHDNFNQLSMGDLPLLRFLKRMTKTGYLNNTALIIMSDHGSRLDDIRATTNGKIEDRMPLFYIVLPTWFKEKFPKAYSNLQENSNRLTSAFDVHKTFDDFIDLNRLAEMQNLYTPPLDFQSFEPISRRPLSLFDRIPENRTCYEAGIPLHWCVCNDNQKSHKETRKDSEEVKSAVAFSIEAMNYHLRSQSSCAQLTLNMITDAFHLDFDVGPGEDKDVRDQEAEAQSKETSKRSRSGLIALRVSFTVAPSGGAFEATLLRDEKGQWALTEQVVRVNKYGDQSSCVEQEYKEFCYCVHN